MPRSLLALILLFLGACTAMRGPSAPTQSADAPDRGLSLLLQTADALGGRDLFAGTEAMAFDLDATLSTPSGDMNATATIAMLTPDRLHRSNVLGDQGEIAFTVVGDRVRFKPIQESVLREASPEEAAYLRAGLYRELPLLLANAAAGRLDATVEYVGEERVEGRRYEVLRVVPPDGLPGYEFYINAETERPHKRVFVQGEATVEDVFSDYREVEGVVLPFRIRSYRDGQLSEDIRYTRATLNADVNRSPFAF